MRMFLDTFGNPESLGSFIPFSTWSPFFVFELQGISWADIFDLSPDQLLGNTSENVGTTSSWWLVIRVSLASQLLWMDFPLGLQRPWADGTISWILDLILYVKNWCQNQNRDIQIEMAQQKRGSIQIFAAGLQIEMLPLIINILDLYHSRQGHLPVIEAEVDNKRREITWWKKRVNWWSNW